ncbi:tyrosine-type recombinase/integrase [Lichenihabitans psoromatis]|uniref:tyrosine-type recombinase/integrase n=1 Tax=Lichenihabitans psoromatis TaxID=2528642 RepID=UPI001AECA2E2|nr:tyrosine-type recombinase/integrase [Lichenihabitans psoromatis]
MSTAPARARNTRIKRAYFIYLGEAKRNGEHTIDVAAAAIARFETYTKGRDFGTFRQEHAIGFKRHLAEQRSVRTSEKLTKATLYTTLSVLKAFFRWLAGQQGYRSKLSYSDADFFHLSAADTAIAKATREGRSPTLEQVHHVLAWMPHETDIEKRDRAIVAFAILTGARDNAIASLSMKHVDLARDRIEQDACEVRTKFSKTMTTDFFPVGEEPRRIVTEWITFLCRERLWGPEDALFPKTKVARGEAGGFRAIGLDRKGWSSAAPIRAIFRRAFEAAGLPYHNPHSLRRTLATLGERVARLQKRSRRGPKTWGTTTS